MNTRINRKIFYAPGIVSLFGQVFIILFCFNPTTPTQRKETVIKHYLPSDNSKDFFSGYTLLEKGIKGKKLIQLELTDEITEDNKKVDFIQSEARRLKFTHDTTTVIKIYLSDEITYGRFVELINIMLKDNHKRYALWKNYFYIFGEPISQQSSPAGQHYRSIGLSYL